MNLSDSLRKIYTSLHPYDHNSSQKQLNTLLELINKKLSDFKALLGASSDLFLSRFDESSEKVCSSNVPVIQEAIEYCKSFEDLEQLEDF